MLFTNSLDKNNTQGGIVTESSPFVIFKNVKYKDEIGCTYAEAYVPKFFGKVYENCPIQMNRTYEVELKHVNLLKYFLSNRKEIDKRSAQALIKYTRNKNLSDIKESDIKAVYQLYNIDKLIMDTYGNFWISFTTTWNEEVTIQVISNSKIMSVDNMTSTVVGANHGFIERCIL